MAKKWKDDEILEYIGTKTSGITQKNYEAPQVITNFESSTPSQLASTVSALNSVEPTVKMTNKEISAYIASKNKNRNNYVAPTIETNFTPNISNTTEEVKLATQKKNTNTQTATQTENQIRATKDNPHYYTQNGKLYKEELVESKEKNKKDSYKTTLVDNIVDEYFIKNDPSIKIEDRGTDILRELRDGYQFGDVLKTFNTIMDTKVVQPASVVAEEFMKNPLKTAQAFGTSTIANIDEGEEKVGSFLNDLVGNKKEKQEPYSMVDMNVSDFNRISKKSDEEKQLYLNQLEKDYANGKLSNYYYKLAKLALTKEDTRNSFEKWADDNMNPDYKDTPIYKEYEKGELSDGLQKVWETGGNLGTQIVPAVVSSMFGPEIGTAYFFAQAAQGYKEEALRRGYTEEEAEKYKYIMGAVESVIERMGFDELGGLKSMADDSLIKAISGEMMEEFATPWIDYGVRTAFGEEYDVDAALNEAIDGAVSAAITSAIMSSGSKGLVKVDNVISKANSGQQISQQELVDAAKELQQNDPNIIKTKVDEYLSSVKDTNYHDIQIYNNLNENQELEEVKQKEIQDTLGALNLEEEIKEETKEEQQEQQQEELNEEEQEITPTTTELELETETQQQNNTQNAIDITTGLEEYIKNNNITELTQQNIEDYINDYIEEQGIELSEQERKSLIDEYQDIIKNYAKENNIPVIESPNIEIPDMTAESKAPSTTIGRDIKNEIKKQVNALNEAVEKNQYKVGNQVKEQYKNLETKSINKLDNDALKYNLLAQENLKSKKATETSTRRENVQPIIQRKADTTTTIGQSYAKTSDNYAIANAGNKKTKLNKQKLISDFKKLTGDSKLVADAKIGRYAVQKLNNNDVQAPYSKEAMDLYELIENSKKTSSYLYHSTPIDRIASIVKNGLKVGSEQNQTGVSSKDKLYLSGSEELARSFTPNEEVTLRIKPSANLENLDYDLLGGEGSYTITNDIDPKYLQVKENGKWVNLLDSKYAKLENNQIKNTESKSIQGLENYTQDEVKDIAKDYINEILEDNYIDDVEIVDMALHGSRLRGTAKANSDLDLVVQYKGDIREDTLFDILNEEKLNIDGIEVDINPIEENLKDYMKRSNEYDKEVMAKLENNQNIKNQEDYTKIKEQNKLSVSDSNIKKFFNSFKNAFDKFGKLKSFKQQINDYENKVLTTGEQLIVLPNTKDLQFAEIDDVPVVESQGDLAKDLTGKHSKTVPRKVIENLPNELKNSVLAMDSRTNDNAKVFILESKNEDGVPLIATIYQGRNNATVDVNALTSVYEKNDLQSFINNTYKDGKKIYTNKKTNDWLYRDRLQLPDRYANNSLVSGNNISQDNKNVKLSKNQTSNKDYDINDIHTYSTDAYSGQVNMVKEIRNKNDDTIGKLEYADYDNKAWIDMLQVDPKYRRQGIATKLLDDLKAEYGDDNIEYGYSTPDGTAFMKGYNAKNNTQNKGNIEQKTTETPKTIVKEETLENKASKRATENNKILNETKKDDVLKLTTDKGKKINLKQSGNDIYERVDTPNAKDVFPDVSDSSVTIGDKKVSNFYSNITEKSKFITEENRESLKDNENLKFYNEINNKDTLLDAMGKLDMNPEQQVGEFFTKDKFDAEDVATGWILIKRYQDAGNYDGMTRVIEKMREQGTKSGQAIQMYGMLQRLTPEGMEYYAQKQLDNAYNKFVENKSKKQIDKYAQDFTLTAEEHQFIQDQMKKVEEATDDDTKKVEIAKIVRMLSDKLPPEKGQGLKAWMRIAMLGNPKTQVRNVMGNAIIQPVNWVGDIFSTAVDKAISKKTGVRTKGNTDFAALAGGFVKGAKESIRDAKLGVDTRDINLNRFEENIGAKPFYEKGKSKVLNAGAKALNKTNEILGNVMSGGDRIFYQSIYDNSLKNQMKANNVTTPTQEMMNIAEQEALSRTWNDSNEYTKAVLQIRNAMNKLNVKGYGLGDVLVPFAKTPANLTKAIVDYSPAGLVRTILQDGKNLKNSLENGQYNAQLQHKFADSLGKGFAGSLLYVAAYALAKAGITTGASDDDKDVANFMRNTLGIQPYSIKIGNKSFTYDWAQPIAAPFAIMADAERLSKKENQDFESIIKTGINSASNILLEQSFLSSIQDVFNNYNGPAAAIQNQIEGLPARATPTFFKQVADLIDPKKRQTYVKGNEKEYVKNQVISKLPGATYSLETQKDTLGRDIEKYGGTDNYLQYAFNVLLNPANTQKGEKSEAAEEIYAVYSATGDKTVMPRQVGYSESVNGQTRNLTAKERNEWQEKSGQLVEENVSGLKNNKKYQAMSDEDKADVIQSIVNYSFNKAKSEVFDTNISTQYKTAAKKEAEGIAIYDYYVDRVSKRK